MILSVSSCIPNFFWKDRAVKKPPVSESPPLRLFLPLDPAYTFNEDLGCKPRLCKKSGHVSRLFVYLHINKCKLKLFLRRKEHVHQIACLGDTSWFWRCYQSLGTFVHVNFLRFLFIRLPICWSGQSWEIGICTEVLMEIILEILEKLRHLEITPNSRTAKQQWSWVTWFLVVIFYCWYCPYHCTSSMQGYPVQSANGRLWKKKKFGRFLRAVSPANTSLSRCSNRGKLPTSIKCLYKAVPPSTGLHVSCTSGFSST